MLTINSQVEIIIDAGIEAESGKVLTTGVSSYFTTEMSPMYASVDDVRKFAGGYMDDVSDDTINQLILKYSVAADNISSCPCSVKATPFYQQIRSYWVILKVTLNIIFNTDEYIATGEGKKFKQLGDFSVSKGEGQRSGFETGVHKFIKWLECEIYKYEYALVNCTVPLSNCLGLTDAEMAMADYMPLLPGLTNRGLCDPHKPYVGRRWIIETTLPEGHNQTLVAGRKFSTNYPLDADKNLGNVRNPHRIRNPYPKRVL